MPKLSQKSFVSGQYDRIAQNQESINNGGIVASGLSYSKNNLSSDKGELRKRLGTKFLKQLDGATVLIPFRMNDENDVVLALESSSGKIVGYKYVDNGVIPLLSVREDAVVAFPAGNTWGDGTANTGTVSNGDWTLSFTFFAVSSGSVIGGLLGSQYPGWLLNGHYTTSTWEGYKIPTDKASAPQSITISNATTESCMRSIKLWFWTASEVGYQYKYWGNPVIQYSDDGDTWVGVQTDYRAGEYTPISYTPPQDVNTQAGIVHMPARYLSKNSLTITQTNYGENHRYWRVYFQTGTASVGAFIDSVSFVDAGETHLFEENVSYTEEQLKNIKYSQDKNTMFIACEGVIPYRLQNNNGELTWGSFTPTNTPTLWETMGGYPAAVSMFQNRVWFGGFQNNPTTVVASKFDDYETFTSGSPVQKDDYLNLRCNQLKTKIRNLVGGQNVMCCFSEDGISYIDGGSTGLLATNENIEFKLKNRMPAGDSTPAFKDDVMLYSSSDGTKLYGVDFDLLVNRFQVSDLAKYAKDITKAKITELHYVNNESKLVYGLMEDGSMFALLYEKGQYQGFFPLDFGGVVYDICPIKVGRNYKLLMVVFRDGNWYLEEKLDMGNYIDTSTPRLTDEEKKWATYDNLENNIALDCYQTYDMSFFGVFRISNSVLLSDTDLTQYENKTIMFSNDNEKDFSVCLIKNISYGWEKAEQNENLEGYSWEGAIAYNGNKFVAIGGTGGNCYVSESLDGKNWTSASRKETLDNNPWQSIAWGVDKFVAVSLYGNIAVSSDGLSWSLVGNIQDYLLKSVVYGDNKFVALDSWGNIATSSDGENWTPQGRKITSQGQWKNICWGGDKYIAVNEDGYVSVSSDGIVWSQPEKVNSSFGKVLWNGDKYISLSFLGEISVSDDGLIWSEYSKKENLSILIDSPAKGWDNFVYGNDTYVALTRAGVVSTSKNPEIGVSYGCEIVVEAQRGETENFTKAYPEFTEFAPNLPQVADVGVISEGRYFNATKPDENALIYLPAPCHKVIYGVLYESVAIIKLQAPYESLKNIAQVDLSVIDSTHLEVGTNFDDTQNIEKIDDSSYYDLTRITMNDTYRLVLSDTPETVKNLILRSNKGVPFTVIAVDMYVNYSNLGGD